MKKIYVIILAFGQKLATLKCLEKVFQSRFNKFKPEVVLVDNGSNDGAGKAVRRKFPQVKIISNQKNLGFAAGVNQGLSRALKDPNAEFFVLLNNDALVDTSTLNNLINTMVADSRIGVLAPAIKHYQKNKLLFGLEGKIKVKKGSLIHRNLKIIRSKKIIKADYVSGCLMIISRQALEKTGLFDERFFLYFEDADFCVRVKQQGFIVCLDPSQVIFHQGSLSLSNRQKLVYCFASNLKFIAKYTPGWYKLGAFLRCLVFYPALIIRGN